MSKGGFFTAYKGDKCIWLSEEYHLYYRDSDTQKEKWYVSKERKEFINHTDTMKHKIDNSTYIIKFMYDTEVESKIRVIEHFHNGAARRVNMDD